MNRSLLLVAAAWLTVGPNSFGWSQDKPRTEVEEPGAKDELAALIARQNTIADQYNAILRRIKEQADVAALDAEVTASQKAVAAAESGDAALTEAREAQRAAVKAFRALVEQKLAKHPEGAKTLAELKKLLDERAALLWDAALAKFQIDSPLSPISRALADDAELAELQAKVQSTSPADRPAVQATLQDRRQAKIAEREDGKTLLARSEEARGAADKLTPTIILVEERLTRLRKEIETAESVVLSKAQAAVDSALGKGNLKERRAAHSAVLDKYNARVKELFAADPLAAQLKEEYDKLGKQVRDRRKAAAKPKERE